MTSDCFLYCQLWCAKQQLSKNVTEHLNVCYWSPSSQVTSYVWDENVLQQASYTLCNLLSSYRWFVTASLDSSGCRREALPLASRTDLQRFALRTSDMQELILGTWTTWSGWDNKWWRLVKNGILWVKIVCEPLHFTPAYNHFQTSAPWNLHLATLSVEFTWN